MTDQVDAPAGGDDTVEAAGQVAGELLGGGFGGLEAGGGDVAGHHRQGDVDGDHDGGAVAGDLDAGGGAGEAGSAQVRILVSRAARQYAGTLGKVGDCQVRLSMRAVTAASAAFTGAPADSDDARG
ncbi:hypothetical protein GCM10022214_44390 [Actinomadura miaoliensis]|uniref:Asp23/Gls24 family envelope stress response protein n=1 Tax=Actinomadura miaoliensis TaxID=430685 RepID=A0ABP7W4I5_9ACTN